MIGYKLTTDNCVTNKHESFYAPYEGRVVYEVGKTTKPREGCGPLAAFDTKKQAMDCILNGNCISTFKLWRCDYEPSKKCILFAPSYPSRITTHQKSLPNGTVLAESITLLEEIRWRT